MKKQDFKRVCSWLDIAQLPGDGALIEVKSLLSRTEVHKPLRENKKGGVRSAVDQGSGTQGHNGGDGPLLAKSLGSCFGPKDVTSKVWKEIIKLTWL